MISEPQDAWFQEAAKEKLPEERQGKCQGKAGKDNSSKPIIDSSRHVVEVVLRSSLTFENNVKQLCELFQERHEFMN